MSGAAESAERLRQWLLTYDVGCQYIAELLERWKHWKLPPSLLALVERLQILLPQLHMLAHKESCHTQYALCYKQGTGHSNGESVESLWAEHNMVGLSTREMNGGARRDALNDFFNSWNWYKNETRGKCIYFCKDRRLNMRPISQVSLPKATGEVEAAGDSNSRSCGADQGGRAHGGQVLVRRRSRCGRTHPVDVS